MALENEKSAVMNTEDERSEENVNEVSGQQADEGAEANAGSQQGSQAKQKPAQKTFTQRQVTRMMTNEKKQGRAAAYRELGIDPNNAEAVALLQSVIQGLNSQKTAEDDGGQKRLEEAEHRAFVAEAKAEAMKMHAKAEYVDDIVTLAISKANKDGSDDLVTLIGEVKAKYANLFDAVESGDAAAKESVGQKGTGSSVRGKGAKGSKDESENNLGARLAAQRKSRGSGKKSFWG